MIDHYFLGPTLVRGFAPSGIGPRDVLNDPTANAVGGTTYFGGTLEVQFPIWGLPRDLGLRGAVFADAGTLFNYDGGSAITPAFAGCPAGSEARQFNVAHAPAQTSQTNIACVRDKNVIRSSVGVSLLWQSPLGPIRFDYAYALTKDDGQCGVNPATGIPANSAATVFRPSVSRAAPASDAAGRSRPAPDRLHGRASFLSGCDLARLRRGRCHFGHELA